MAAWLAHNSRWIKPGTRKVAARSSSTLPVGCSSPQIVHGLHQNVAVLRKVPRNDGQLMAIAIPAASDGAARNLQSSKG
jgi:hypothetical protein